MSPKHKAVEDHLHNYQKASDHLVEGAGLQKINSVGNADEPRRDL